LKREVRLSVRARIDLERLADFLLQKNVAAATRARSTLAEALRSLEEFADHGRPGPAPDLRELPIRFGRSAYVIQYRVEADRVIVAHIFHALEGG